MSVIGGTLLRASRNLWLQRAAVSTEHTRRIANRFVAGDSLDDAMNVIAVLTADGMAVTLDHLGENATDRRAALASRDAYLRALDAMNPMGYRARVEVSVKLSAFGQSLANGDDLAFANALAVAESADAIGTTITLDMEAPSTVDSTLAIHAALRSRFPGTGAVLQSYLHRTLGDAEALAVPGSRVRLVKGAYRAPRTIALQSKAEVNRAFEQCLAILMSGAGYPMVASHDPRMIARALELAGMNGRPPGSFEFQMLLGVRPSEQRRLVATGRVVRTYVPYGADWYGYFMRRLAERPANLTFFLRAVGSRDRNRGRPRSGR